MSGPASGVSESQLTVGGHTRPQAGTCICTHLPELFFVVFLSAQAPGQVFSSCSLRCVSALSHTLVQTVARGVFEVIVDQSACVPQESVEERKTKEDGSGFPTKALACRKAVSGKKAGERLPLILFPFCWVDWLPGFSSFLYTSFVCVHERVCSRTLSCGGQMSALGVTVQLSPTPILR